MVEFPLEFRRKFLAEFPAEFSVGFLVEFLVEFRRKFLAGFPAEFLAEYMAELSLGFLGALLNLGLLCFSLFPNTSTQKRRQILAGGGVGVTPTPIVFAFLLGICRHLYLAIQHAGDFCRKFRRKFRWKFRRKLPGGGGFYSRKHFGTPPPAQHPPLLISGRKFFRKLSAGCFTGN